MVITMAVAVSGVSSASAVTLCKASAEECPLAKRYPAAQIYNAEKQNVAQFEVGETVLFKWVLDWEAWCEETSFVWKTVKQEGEFLVGTLPSISFGTCFPGMSCKVEMIHIPYRTELRWEADDDGRLRFADNGEGKPTVVLKQCGPLGVTCAYEEGMFKIWLDVYGGGGNPPPEVGVDDVLLAGVAGNPMPCGPYAIFKGWYRIFSPEEPIFVSPKP